MKVLVGLALISIVITMNGCAQTDAENAIEEAAEQKVSNASNHRRYINNLRCVDGILYFADSKWLTGVKIDPVTLKPQTCDWIWEKI